MPATTGPQGYAVKENHPEGDEDQEGSVPVWAALITAYISCSEQNTHQRQ